MNTLAKNRTEENFQALKVSFTDSQICIFLSDGREVKTPLAFYPKLLKATEKQRQNFKIIGLGSGITWPEIDEDLSVEGIVLGRRAYDY